MTPESRICVEVGYADGAFLSFSAFLSFCACLFFFLAIRVLLVETGQLLPRAARSEAVEGSGAVEHDEGLPSAAGTELLIRDQRVTRQGPPVGGMSGELTFLRHWAEASQDPREPLRLATAVLPAVQRRTGQ